MNLLASVEQVCKRRNCDEKTQRNEDCDRVANAFQVIPTPGHAEDHISLYEPQRGWLFTGDLYLAPKLRYLRADEDIYAMLDSLRRVTALEPDSVFCQHRGRVEDGTAMLRRKLDFLVQLGERIHDLHAKGLDHDEIACALPGSDLLWRTWTAGHFSKRHFVSAFLRPDVPSHVQTPK